MDPLASPNFRGIHAYLWNSLARTKDDQTAADTALQYAQQGIDIPTADGMVRANQQADQAGAAATGTMDQIQGVVEQTKNLSDKDFDKAIPSLIQQIGGDYAGPMEQDPVGRAWGSPAPSMSPNYQQAPQGPQTGAQTPKKGYPAYPTRKKAKMGTPDLGQLFVALLGAGLNPRYAAQIMASPFVAQLAKYGEDVKMAGQEFKDAEGQYGAETHRIEFDARQAMQQAELDMRMLNAKAEAGDKKAANIYRAVGRILQANVAGDPTIALEELRELDSERAAEYEPIARAQEARLAKQNAQADIDFAERKESSDLRQQTLANRLSLFPYQEQMAKMGLNVAGLKQTLLESKVRMLPETEKSIRLRNELMAQRKHWYPIEVGTRVNMASYYASLAWGTFERNRMQFNQNRDEWAYRTLVDGIEWQRQDLERERDELRDETKELQTSLDFAVASRDKESETGIKAQMQKNKSDLAANERKLQSLKPPKPPRFESQPPAPPEPPTIPGTKGVKPPKSTQPPGLSGKLPPKKLGFPSDWK